MNIGNSKQNLISLCFVCFLFVFVFFVFFFFANPFSLITGVYEKSKLKENLYFRYVPTIPLRITTKRP